MASAYSKDGKWYLRYKDAAGRWRGQVSTARTKTEAKKLARELESRAERERLGLEAPMPTDGGGTLAELLKWWLTTYSTGSPSHATNDGTIRRHLLNSELAALPLITVTSGRIEAFLQSKAAELAPQTLNHLRGYLSRAFNAARRTGKYAGQNPAALVAKRRVPRRQPDFLREHEVGPLMDALAPRWQPLFATAIYAGLRKGELLGLRKVDVDLQSRLLTVAHSHDRDTTKGGRAEVIPIAAELVPFLEMALKASPSALVFPRRDGTMMRRDVGLEAVLRRALGRAGVVTGYTHVCRAKGCKHVQAAPDRALRRCPEHDHALWVKPVVRPIRFHDLRHTTASLLMMRGANPAAVQRILRHSDPKITTEVYGHLSPGYLQSEVDRLRFQPATTEAPAPPASDAKSVPVATSLLRIAASGAPGTVARNDDREIISGVWIGAGNRIRTGDPQLGKLMLYQLSYSRPDPKG